MDKKMIIIVGGVVLIVGVFLPVASALGINVSFMFPGEGVSWEGLVLLACGLLGVILAFIGQGKHAAWLGIAALGLLIWKYMEFKNELSRAGASLPEGIELPPELAAAMPSLNMLGWAVLGIGALIMTVGGAMAWKSDPPAAAA